MKLQQRSSSLYFVCCVSFLGVYVLYNKQDGVVYPIEAILMLLVFILITIPSFLLIGFFIWLFRGGSYLVSCLYATYYSSVFGIAGYGLAIMLWPDWSG